MDLTANPIDKEIRPSERVLWRGQPLARLLLGPEDVFMIPFSLMWGGFAVFWEGSALGLVPIDGGVKHGHEAPLFFVLWGIPFVCVGLYMIFGRFLHMRWAKQHTWYALTDKRIIIVTEGFSGHSVKEQDLNSSPRWIGACVGIMWVPIDFVPPGTTFRRGQWPVQKLGTMAFIDIPEIDRVYGLLQKARAEAES